VHEFFSYWYEWVRSPNRRRPALRQTGLPQSATSILHRLTYGGPVHLSALARSLGLDTSTISRQLEPLRAEGLVVERPLDANPRATEISLSAKGRGMSRRIAKAQTEYWACVLERMPAKDRFELARLLVGLRNAMEAHDAAQ
jgi:DNA-binding MarR family transcriptional regulator